MMRSDQVIVDWAAEDEHDQALHLLLLGHTNCQTDSQLLVEKFSRQLQLQGLHPGWCLVVRTARQLAGVLLALPTPGSTVSVLLNSTWTDQNIAEAMQQGLHLILQRANHQQLTLIQALVTADDRPGELLLQQAGFTYLAELQYMACDVPATISLPPCPQDDCRIINYDEAHRAIMAEALQQTYIDSQDCPGLTELRSIDEVIQTHQATGIFDPALWWVVCHDTQPVAVLLLTQVPEQPQLEVVYIGVTPAYRRRGWCNWLMHHALAITYQRQGRQLLLAVDARNLAARRIYERLGFQLTDTRHAWTRSLRHQRLVHELLTSNS
ncbi:MAG: Mycothiol acetyltransferase [Phycisphaerae bacterium]|nr:Mycothiol acetyltransferase [Phycisphaerae bacterium]